MGRPRKIVEADVAAEPASPTKAEFRRKKVLARDETSATPKRSRRVRAGEAEKPEREKPEREKRTKAELVEEVFANTAQEQDALVRKAVADMDGAETKEKTAVFDEEPAEATSGARGAPEAAYAGVLPGILAAADTHAAMRVVVVAATASSAVSALGRAAIDGLAASSTQSWAAWTAHLGATTLQGVGSPITALVVRICKLALAWGAFANLAALDVLAYGPIIYLYTSFYDVPLTPALVSAAVDVVADFAPLVAWEQYVRRTGRAAPKPATFSVSDGAAVARVLDDPITYAISSAFAAALYGFTFVQACRLFLPSTFVVHFMGISTVEPARAQPVSASFPPSFAELGLAVFLSWPAVLLSIACGVAARTYIFTGTADRDGDEADETDVDAQPHAYAKAVGVRAGALSLAVGVGMFVQCFLGIQGVDAVGAASYASVWAAAPLMVGAGLGLVGV